MDVLDVVAFGVVNSTFLGVGVYIGTKFTFKRSVPWQSRRLIKFSGDRGGEYVETRDTGRCSRFASYWFGPNFRYTVKVFKAGVGLIEERTYKDADAAADWHEDRVTKYGVLAVHEQKKIEE